VIRKDIRELRMTRWKNQFWFYIKGHPGNFQKAHARDVGHHTNTGDTTLQRYHIVNVHFVNIPTGMKKTFSFPRVSQEEG
jgi:hypothetical protein